MADENQSTMLNARRPCFFEIFPPNLSAQRLRIPERFRKHIEGRTSGVVSLTGPSGNIWPVNLIQETDCIFLDHGWPDFVNDHFIECGDLMVFRYDGELCFTVQVFDVSGCEKEAAFHSKCSLDPSEFYRSIGQKREREEKGASSDKIGECVPKRSKKAPSECQSELVVAATGKCQQESSSYKTAQCERNYNEMPEATIRKRIGKEGESFPHRGYGAIFSEQEKKIAQSFISCFPYFVRIMKRFNISGSYTLNIPYQFSTAHLPACKTEIVLRTIKGGVWTVNSVPTTRVHTSHTFCGGWMAFVRNNEIKLGDVCIFELVRKYEFRVFILRIGKEVLGSQGGEVASDGLSVGCDTISQKLEIFPKSRKSALKVHSRVISKVEHYNKKGSAKSHAAPFSDHTEKCGRAIKGSESGALSTQPRVGNEKLDVVLWSGKNSDSELSLDAGAGLRMLVALSEKDAAKSFTSAFPNFVRVMRKFNISGSYTLKIPHKFSAAYLPNQKSEIVLRNSQGECWTVNSLPDSKGRRVHTFCGGWMAFVRDNGVKIGDICIFELVSELEMLVHISGVGEKALCPC